MIYLVGAIAIDTDAYEVRRDGSPVAVEPQVFDLLVLLVQNPDRIVTRDEIIERVWKGRIVSDTAISSRIKAARRAIGDDGKAQGLIRTIHRRGLRFVGDVVIEGAVSSSARPGSGACRARGQRAAPDSPRTTRSLEAHRHLPTPR